MLGRNHLATGVMSGLAVCALVGPPPAMVPVIVGVSAYSALTPDLDHPAAPAARCLGPVSWLLCWLVRNLSARTTGHTHRGLTHSVVFALGWGVLVAALSVVWLPVQVSAWIGLAAVLGCLTHICGDLLTLSGCQYVLWPARAQVSWPHVLRFRTGSATEYGLVALLGVGSVFLLPAVFA